MLRQEILARRDSLPTLQRQEKNCALAARLGTLDCFNQARSILFFVSFRSEVDTLFLMRQALERGVQVSAPLTSATDKELKIYALKDLEIDLVPGYQGILEPNPRRCPQLDPGSLDVVIVPGSVFDLQGGRMGYGGGYYDRFLANRAPQATRVGICFDLQLVAEVPMAAHDQYLDYVVTESQIAQSGHLR
ncbi:MAG: 5-formyltetrahydrofolate cyclo-ligase [Proteobacteria bacterium]|nr:5-formyltetrahydrofolate cyclo-ligase [Pseudomonadota bacterium]MBU1640573.1 5-formyltetrahydrofolate cyclo-ligase [Pseudomonadota bacterium]